MTAISHTVLEGKVIVRPRNNTKNWEAKYKVGDGWRRTSTGTNDLNDAKDVALGFYMEAQALSERGIRVRTNGKLTVTFADVAKMYRQQMMEDLASGVGKPVYKSYINIIEKWFVPFFKDMPLDVVDDDAIYSFERHRLTTLGREPAKTTINSHNCVFRAIFDLARRKKYVQSNQIPRFTVRGKGKKTVRRPAFTPKEVVRLEKFMLGWAMKGDRSITRYKRHLLFYYVRLLLASGIRTGKEIDSIQWKHVDEDYRNPVNNIHYIRVFLPHRKTERPSADDHVLVSMNFKHQLDSLKKLTRRTEPDDYLFSAPDGSVAKGFSEMFRHCLEEAGLRYNARGEGRTLYSLRHYYATQAIAKHDVPYDILARHMATSMLMLEKHYVDVDTEREAEKLAPSFKVFKPEPYSGERKHALQQIDMMNVDDETKALLRSALK